MRLAGRASLRLAGRQIAALADLRVADSGGVGVVQLAVFHVTHADKIETPRSHRRFQVQMRVVALIEADGFACEIAQLSDRVPMDHGRRGDEIDHRSERRCFGEAMVGDLGAVEEKQIVGAISDPRKGFV